MKTVKIENMTCANCGSQLKEGDSVDLDVSVKVGMCRNCLEVLDDYNYQDLDEFSSDQGYCSNCGSPLSFYGYRTITDPVPFRYIEQYTCREQLCELQGHIIEFD